MSDKPVHSFVPNDATSGHAQMSHDGMARFVQDMNKPPAKLETSGKAEGAMVSLLRNTENGIAGGHSDFGRPMPPKVETLDTDTSKLYAA